MKRALFWLVVFGFAFSVGCGPSGDDDDDNTTYTVESGVYTFANTAVAEDGCGLGTTPGDLDGTTTELVVNGSTIEVDGGSAGGGFDMTMSGNNASYSETGQQDFNGNGIDCILDVAQAIDGTLTANNEIDISQDVDASVNSGTQCDQVETALGITFPCHTGLSSHLSRTGDIP